MDHNTDYPTAVKQVLREDVDLRDRYCFGSHASEVEGSAIDGNASNIIYERAAHYSQTQKASLLEATHHVLNEDPQLAKAYENNGPTAYQLLANVVTGPPKLPDHSLDIPLVLQHTALHPTLVREPAAEFIRAKAITLIAGRLPGFTSDHIPDAINTMRAQLPALAAAADSGVLSEAGLRELYPQFFHD